MTRPYGLDHDPGCKCPICRRVRDSAVLILPEDRNIYAHVWETWVSTVDGEAAKLRAGEDGAIGSPRWVALQAIAMARMIAAP